METAAFIPGSESDIIVQIWLDLSPTNQSDIADAFGTSAHREVPR